MPNFMKIFDICIVGSGAGAGSVAYTLSQAGYKVLVLEKGKWHTDFYSNCTKQYDTRVSRFFQIIYYFL